MVDFPRYDAADIGLVYPGDDRDVWEKYDKIIAPFFRIAISDQSDEVLFSADAIIYDGNYDLNGMIVSEVSWDENDCQASSMSIKVQNPDMTLQDSRIFAEGNSVDLWMGYDGLQPDYMGRGIIVERQPEFPRNGIPTISINLYDISYFMMEEGRAEIVPEGTAWFERRTQTNSSSSSSNSVTRTAGNHVDDSDEGRDERNRGTTVGGQQPAPQVTVANSGRNVAQLDLAQRQARAQVADQPAASSNAGNTTRTTSWQQARIPRRRRRSGKVWRELRDEEIVEKIFWSYGILPYTEATNQRSRSRLESQADANERRAREVTNSDQVSDTEFERRNRRRREQSLGLQQQTPDQTVESDIAQLDLAEREARSTLQTVTAAQTQPATRQRVGGRRVVQKSGTSDWEFIKKLAKSHGHIVFVFFDYPSSRWVGYWGPPQNVPQHTTYDFRYNFGDRSSLGAVKPTVSMRGQKTEISLSFVDPRSGRTQRLRVSMEDVSQYASEFRGPDGPSEISEPLGNGPQVTLTIHGQRVQTIANRPFTDMDDARRWLMSFWYRHASDFCQISGDTIIGLPEMRARQYHGIIGIGRISGSFFITKVTHSMKPKALYETKFSGYRVVDFLESPVTPDSDLLTVDSENIGESTPEESNG